MKKYELFLILPGTLDEKESETRAGEVLGMVKEHSEEADMHLIGKNRLAYPIKNIRYGYFYTITFQAEPEKVNILQKKLVLSRDILRAIISLYNAKASGNQKITYFTDNMGMTNIVEEGRREEAIAEEQIKTESHPTKKLDIKDIDRKLDEILQGNLMPEV